MPTESAPPNRATATSTEDAGQAEIHRSASDIARTAQRSSVDGGGASGSDSSKPEAGTSAAAESGRRTSDRSDRGPSGSGKSTASRWGQDGRGPNWGRNQAWKNKQRGSHRGRYEHSSNKRKADYESDSMAAASDLLRSRLTLIHRGLKGVAAAQAAFDACSVDVQLRVQERATGDDREESKRRRYESPRHNEDGHHDT